MIRFVRKRLTYANVIATLALLFAMTGGAFAATHYLINSTRQINPRVLRALQGKAGTTGKTGPAGAQGAQGKEGPQGKEGATGKEGAQGKEGQQGREGPQGPEGPSSVVHWRVNATPGSSKESPNAVKLAELGSVTVWGHCYLNGGNTAAATYVSTSQGGTYLQSFVTGQNDALHAGRQALANGTHYQVSEGVAEGTTSSHEAGLLGPNTSGFALQNGSVAVTGLPSQAVWLAGSGGAPCTFSGYVVVQ